jgi:3-phenylpropionate/trans-cinnamate dioxygenase ferredoxin reductase subunit
MAAPRSVLVVGAGLAGANVAFRLRKLGYAGRIVMVGEEKYQAYDRPPTHRGEPDRLC